MASSPLAALCVSDVSQKCAGKSGLRQEVCEAFWKMEAADCPAAMRTIHQSCVASVQRLEQSPNVCKAAEAVLAPGVASIAAYIKDPALSAEFVQNWPSMCSDLQTKFSQNLGDGEKICTEVEANIMKMVAKRS